MSFRFALLLLVGGCYTGAPAAPVVEPVKPVAGPPGVTPKVRITTAEPDAGDAGQMLEGWPPIAFDHLPAVSVDRKKIAVVEERDGWGHTPTPGVRILDMSGQTLVWLPVVTGEQWIASPQAEELRLRAIEGLIAEVNAELARTSWYKLETPSEPASSNEGDDRMLAWKLGDHEVTARFVGWGADNEDSRYPAPHEIVVKDGKGAVVTKLEHLNRRWLHGGRCATPSFGVAGVHAASRVVVFHQKLGRTSHGCDGVPVPDDWRILKF